MSYLESLQSNSSCTCIKWDEETTIIGIVTFFRLKDNLSLFLSELIIEKWNVKLRMCKTVAFYFTALKLQQSQYIVCLTAELFRLSQRSLSLIMWYGSSGSAQTSQWPWRMTFTTTSALPLNLLPLYWPNTVTVSKVIRCYKFQLVWLWERSICDSLMMNVSLSALTFSQLCPLSWYDGDFTLAYWNPAFLPALFALISCSL